MNAQSRNASFSHSYLTSYAADHGFTHCRHYTDDGFSGGNFERTGWKQLIADIDAGLVGVVIAKDLSRVGRDYIQTGFYTEVYFRRKGVCRTLVQEKRVTPGYYRFQHSPDGVGKQHTNRQPHNWDTRMLTKLVQRREYMGDTVNFKTCVTEYRGKRVSVPAEEQLVFPGTHEAIVDEETWQAAQQIFHPEMSFTPGRSCALKGLMVCGECGVPMKFHRMTGHEECNDFVCRTHQKSAAYEERLCTHNSIRVTVIREIVRDTLRSVNRYAIADADGFRRRLAQEAAAYQPDDRKQLAKHIREKEKHIARLEHLLKKLYEDYALGHIPEERFDKLSAQYEQEEAMLKAELADDQARLNEVQTASAQTDKFLALARKYRDCTEVTDDMILAFVEKIVVYRAIRPAKGRRTRQIEVHLNYIGQFPIPTEGMENENE